MSFSFLFSVGCQMKNAFLVDANESMFNRLMKLCGEEQGWCQES